jgi:SAM-dependent methyltransferase
VRQIFAIFAAFIRAMTSFKEKADNFILGPLYRQRMNTLEMETKGVDSMLDLGCGNKPLVKQVTRNIKRSVGLDIFQPSIDAAKINQTHSEFILADALEFLAKAESKSFDIIMALDLIEHLEKEKGIWFMQQLERVAKKKVIIFTPNGFVPQKPYEDNPWQEHKSGWSFKEMKDYGYRIYGFGGYMKWRGELYLIKYKPRIVFKFLSYFTQLFTYKLFPSKAFALLCIKDIKQ